MDDTKLITRRSMLKISGASLVALSASTALAGRLNELCLNTPMQPKGPFYPVKDQEDKDTDLTVNGNSGSKAVGTIIYLSGKVMDGNCAPIRGAVVDIWQACASGRYNHPGDQDNDNPLDPNFQYWGLATTKEDGSYSFKTIMPGHYAAGDGWMRPPHIHFKVSRRGYKEIITQMYFEGNQYNRDDRILRSLSSTDQAAVVRRMSPMSDEGAQKAFAVTFDITLAAIR